jgi:hypothetical protein
MIKKYGSYIEEHVVNIRDAWKIIKERVTDDIISYQPYIMPIIKERVKVHDISKLSENEFEGYRQFFYPCKGEEPDKDLLNKAWLHHIHNNDHHWEHWVICGINDNAIEMPFECIFEMLLDWAAMSIKFDDSPRQFYEKNKSTMLFHENSIKTIESIIDMFTLKKGNLNQELLERLKR